MENSVVLLSDMRRVRWAVRATWLLCYVYAVGMRISDVDMIGEELQQSDGQTRLLCSDVRDRIVPGSKQQRYENAREAKTMRN